MGRKIRGHGRAYRAAALVEQGVPIEEAADREVVTVPSVIRVIKYGDRRTS